MSGQDQPAASPGCTCRKGAKCGYCMERDQFTTAECAFEDSLIALREIDQPDIAERLRTRWQDVDTPT